MTQNRDGRDCIGRSHQGTQSEAAHGIAGTRLRATKATTIAVKTTATNTRATIGRQLRFRSRCELS